MTWTIKTVLRGDELSCHDLNIPVKYYNLHGMSVHASPQSPSVNFVKA